MYIDVSSWVSSVVEAVASGGAVATALAPGVGTLPILGPVVQLVSVVGELARSEVVRSEMKEEKKSCMQSVAMSRSK